MCFAAHDWHAHTLQQKDGLSSNNVECIFKDSYGFMWFGTSNGLDRYDAAKIWSFNQTGISVNGKWNSLAYFAVRYTPN
jgi:ligand-binding sensor domain-containing protein